MSDLPDDDMSDNQEQDAAMQGAPAPASAPTTSSELPHPAGASGQQPAAVSVAQSEPTPQITKPPIDPRPYAWVAQHDPKIKSWIDNASRVTGVDPIRIAAHLYAESGFNPNVKRGGDGEIGMGQMLPSTAAHYTAGGRLDPFNPTDNVLMSALYMRDLDAKYGKDSFASVAHYNGSGPAAAAYARKLMPTAPESDEMQLHAGDGSTTPQGLVQAGVQGGPDGFLRYVVQTAPKGLPVSDAWRHAEALLVNAFIQKGDIAGAQHARDFVFQMSHAGSNQYLMAAHQALSAGNGTAAAQYLAKAHAFFPDGTIGRFRSDGTHVFAERLDENDPSQRLGASMPVTTSDIAGLLNQTLDPQQYLKTLNTQQAAAADARLKQLHGDYYQQLPAIRQAEVNQRDAASQRSATSRLEAANTSALGRVTAAQVRADALAGKQDLSGEHMIEKETNDLYNPQTSPDQSPEALQNLGKQANIYRALRTNHISGPQAQAVTKGLASGDLQVKVSPDKTQAGVFNKSGKALVYLPPSAVSQLAGAPPAPPQRTALPSGVGPATVSPIGAGAASPYALGAGITSNLSGTVMPQR